MVTKDASELICALHEAQSNKQKPLIILSWQKQTATFLGVLVTSKPGRRSNLFDKRIAMFRRIDAYPISARVVTSVGYVTLYRANQRMAEVGLDGWMTGVSLAV